MEYNNEYLNELFDNLDSPVAILELWDTAMAEKDENVSDLGNDWITIFDELYRWNISALKSSVKLYYQNLEKTNAAQVIQFLSLAEFNAIVPFYMSGIGNAENSELMKSIDSWIDDNDEIIDTCIQTLLVAHKDWFYQI